ncbi:HBS1-like protein isoform X4 [Ascaphus truei]|uniref:HBS1-like protein isoform X4 n=1 Tax=Ascaphus truei TaxID=8439 RepID=UPI003F599AE1
MARHRNVRGYNYDEDFEEDDLFGQSVEDDYCISPATAAQFIYSKREKPSGFAEPLEEEEDGEEETPDNSTAADISLSAVDQARLYSCLDHMREVLGDTVVEQVMIDAVLQSKFDEAKALDLVLTQDCNKNTNPVNQDSVSTGKTAKEAKFCSLQSLADEHSLSSAEKLAKCTAHAHFDLTLPIQESSLSRLGLGSRLDVETEKYVTPLKCDDKQGFSDTTADLSLATLLSESSKQTFFSPKADSSISLLDLISDSKEDAGFRKGSDLLGAKLSEISSAQPHESMFDVPDLKQWLEEDTFSSSLSLATCNQSSVKSAADISLYSDCFPRNVIPGTKATYKQPDLLGSLSSVLQNTEVSTSNDEDNLFVPKYGSPSLADLIQEHNEINPLQDVSLCSLQKHPSSSTDMQLGSRLPLSHLSDLSHATFQMPALSKSLSSLAVSDRSEAKETQVSLFDRIVKVSKPFPKDSQRLLLSSTLPLTETDTSIDLSVLINNPGDTAEACVHLPKVTTAKPGRPSRKDISSKKRNICEGHKTSSYWGKTLKARPSAFALSLCFSYIPKACKKSILMIHQCHHNSPVDETSTMVQPAIIPFNFQTPSPDDVVKANQKKAFVR